MCSNYYLYIALFHIFLMLEGMLASLVKSPVLKSGEPTYFGSGHEERKKERNLGLLGSVPWLYFQLPYSGRQELPGSVCNIDRDH